MGKIQILDSLVKALKLPEEESGMQGEGSQRRKSASFYFTSYTALRFVQSALLGVEVHNFVLFIYVSLTRL